MTGVGGLSMKSDDEIEECFKIVPLVTVKIAVMKNHHKGKF